MLDGDNIYIGHDDVTAWPGHIEIAADIGTVYFKTDLSATGCIRALSGSDIEAGRDIKAGWGIKAGRDIEAGLSICAKYVSCNLRIFAGLCSWRLPDPDEQQVRAEIRSGTLSFGKHVKADETEAADEIESAQAP